MPICKNCRGIGKVIDKKFKVTIVCSDCDGRGIISDKMLEFINFYDNKKKIEQEIETMQNDSQFIEQYEKAIDS